jgi:hypothetical protein
MNIIRTRHIIESTSLLDMNHRYIKGILSAPKVSWEVNLYLGLRAFHREWSLRVESKQSSMIVGFYRLFAIPSFVPHIIKVALCGLTLLIHLRTSHMYQISSCDSMILRVRAQSIHAIGCHHLCVSHRDLLLTSPSVGCCLFLLFPMLLGSLFCSKLLNFISCDLMEALPKLLFVVVVLISTILFSSCCCCLFFVDPPCVHNRTYTKILFHWKLYKITFPTGTHSS